MLGSPRLPLIRDHGKRHTRLYRRSWSTASTAVPRGRLELLTDDRRPPLGARSASGSPSTAWPARPDRAAYCRVRDDATAVDVPLKLAVVPSRQWWREAPAVRVRNRDPQPEEAGPLGHGRDSGARSGVVCSRPASAPPSARRQGAARRVTPMTRRLLLARGSPRLRALAVSTWSPNGRLLAYGACAARASVSRPFRAEAVDRVFSWVATPNPRGACRDLAGRKPPHDGGFRFLGGKRSPARVRKMSAAGD